MSVPERVPSAALTAACAAIALGSWAFFTPEEPAGPAAAAPRPRADPAAKVDFGMPPTVPTNPLSGEKPRRILALYNSLEKVPGEGGGTRAMGPETALAHRLGELPLNHLGLAVDHADVNALPAPEEMARYRGVLAWFEDPHLRSPEAYLGWLIAQVHAGRRVAVLGDLGTLLDRTGRRPAEALVAKAMQALGAKALGHATDDSSLIAVAYADPKVLGFERPLPERHEIYRMYQAPPPAKVYLQLERTDEPDSLSDVVFTSPTGGFVLTSFGWVEDRLEGRWVTRWLIDPFVFFGRAFDVGGWPRPDFTTLNGRRLFYSHIDGDGLDTITELDKQSRSGAVIRDRILKRYALPFTASIVVGLTAPPPIGRGTPDDVAVARSILALDNVEVGSHGLAHPMDWRGGAEAELSVTGLPGGWSGEGEVAESVAYIDESLAPPGKPCRIMLWTGWCNPAESELEIAYRLGLRNLNGGDPRMDAWFPSYAHLVPPVHVVGKWYQYYTSAANDYILTEEWTPPYYRFQNVIQTFERSGAPRRVVPINVYFHFYSGRNFAALSGLERALDWAAAQPTAPVFASEYVDVARDFQWARIASEAPDRWTIVKGPALRTVRFDDPKVVVDVPASRGVLGYLNDPALGVTYVHLDGSSRVSVQLAEQEVPGPRLESASAWVDAIRTEGPQKDLVIAARGIGPRSFVLAGMEPGARYAVGIDGAAAVASADGRLTLSLGVSWSPEPIQIRVAREGAR